MEKLLNLLRAFARYFFVQGVLYLLDMGVFLFLYYFFSFSAIGANIIGKVLGGLSNFIAHRFFTFGVIGRDKLARQSALFFTLLLINIPVSTFLLHLFLKGIALPAMAKLLTDGISLGINFYLIKTFIFTPNKIHASPSTEQNDG